MQCFKCASIRIAVFAMEPGRKSFICGSEKKLDSGICSDLYQCTHLADEMEVQKI